jgi:hypothetical protein
MRRIGAEGKRRYVVTIWKSLAGSRKHYGKVANNRQRDQPALGKRDIIPRIVRSGKSAGNTSIAGPVMSPPMGQPGRKAIRIAGQVL